MSAMSEHQLEEMGRVIEPCLDEQFYDHVGPSMYEEAANAVTVSDDGVHRLANQAQMLLAAQETVAQCVEDLKVAMDLLKKLEEKEIPDTMQELGVQEFTLTNGAKISVANFYSGSITEENKTKAHKWLEDHEYGALIKKEVTCKFDKGSGEEAKKLMEKLDEEGYVYSNTESVHAQTLKKLVKDTSENTEEGAVRLPKDLFGVYIGKKAKVTIKK